MYAYGVFSYSGRYMDDAYITFRFAKNTAEGYLFTWNIGEMPIEGFSNPLWTIITSIFHLFGLLPIENSTYYFAAIIIGLVLIHLYDFATRTLNINSLLVVFFISFFLLQDYFWHSMFNGLETFLQMAILYFSVYYLFKPLNKKNVWIMSILIILLILNRFEGFLYAIVVVVSYTVIHFKNQDHSKYMKWLPLITYVITLFSVFLFRFLYFGEFIPLSVEAKSGGKIKDLESIWLLLQNKAGWIYVFDFFTKTTLIALIPTYVLIFFLKLSRKFLSIFIPVLFLFSGSCLIAVQNGGDWMPGFRMLSPFAPILLLIFLLLFSEFKINYAPKKLQKYSLFVLLLLATLFGMFSTSKKHNFYLDRSYWEKKYKENGKYWNNILKNNETYSAARAGSLPYMANHIKVTDFHGLVYSNMGRDRKLKSSMMGKAGLKKFDYVFFPKNHVLFDANHYQFAKGVFREAKKRNILLEVVLKNNKIQISNKGFVTFVKKEFEQELLKRDPSLIFISFDKYRKLFKF
jgi:hypothetical protein